jgi:hypothetical protein
VPDDTPTEDVSQLPGYAPGFKTGYRVGLRRALQCLRLAMIEDGTDPGEAYLLAEKLQRWIAANGG